MHVLCHRGARDAANARTDIANWASNSLYTSLTPCKVPLMFCCSVHQHHKSIVVYSVVLHSIVLYSIALYSIVLYSIVLYSIVVYCIVLHCTALHCIVLYCMVLCCIFVYFKHMTDRMQLFTRKLNNI